MDSHIKLPSCGESPFDWIDDRMLRSSWYPDRLCRSGCNGGGNAGPVMPAGN